MNTNNWETEFEEKLGKEWNYRHVVNKDTVKSFISKLLLSKQQELEKAISEIKHPLYIKALEEGQFISRDRDSWDDLKSDAITLSKDILK